MKIQDSNQGFWCKTWQTAKSLVAPLSAVLIIRTFLFSPFTIPSGSMFPNLLIGDYIVVNKFCYGFSRYSLPFHVPLFRGRFFLHEPKRGDIAVFVPPKKPDIYYVKRIIGLPGDVVEIKGEKLWINGTPVLDALIEEEEFLIEGDGRFSVLEETLPSDDDDSEPKSFEILQAQDNSALTTLDHVFSVPKGQFFVMGDNRDRSLDSRFSDQVGFIPHENLVGRAEIIVASFDKSADLRTIAGWRHFVRGDRLLKRLN